MKDSEMTVRLWQMNKFKEAYEKNHVSPPNKKRGMWSPDGWIINIFWNGKKANDGMAAMRKVRKEYPEYFESEYVSKLKEIYGNAFYRGNTPQLEAQRIKPEKRKEWSVRVNTEIRWAEKELEEKRQRERIKLAKEIWLGMEV